MKPWELNPGGVDAPVEMAQQVWMPPASAKADQQPKPNAPVNSDSLTPEELRQYLEFSRRTMQARIDAENFDMEMMQALRLDFAERRLNKHGHG